MGACEAPSGLRVAKKARSPQILPPASEIKWVHPMATFADLFFYSPRVYFVSFYWFNELGTLNGSHGQFITFIIDCYYIYGGSGVLHLWLNLITFMVGRLLHLWLNVITFMVGITFMVDFYYIYGGYYIYGCYYIYGWYILSSKSSRFVFFAAVPLGIRTSAHFNNATKTSRFTLKIDHPHSIKIRFN